MTENTENYSEFVVRMIDEMSAGWMLNNVDNIPTPLVKMQLAALKTRVQEFPNVASTKDDTELA